MTTEAQETTGTAPAAAATTTTATSTITEAAPEAPATPRSVFEQGRINALARVEAMRAEKAAAGKEQATPSAQAAATGQEGAAESSGQATGEKPGEEAAQADGAATATAAEDKTEPADGSDEAKAAQELLAAARENRALIAERRRLAARDAELKAREAKLTTATVPERETVTRIMKARESNDPVEVLRAAGYTEKDLGDFALNLIDRMGKLDGEEEEKKPPRPPTAEEVAALVVKQAEERAAAKAKADEDARAEQVQQTRNEYFAKIGAEFKVNAKSYPVLAAIRPTHAQLDACFVEHFDKTGERLTPAQLLATLEKEYSGRGLTLAPKKPTPTPPAATARTIGQGATSDGGPVVVRDEVKTSTDKTGDPYKLHEQGRAAAIAEIERRRAAKRAAR